MQDPVYETVVADIMEWFAHNTGLMSSDHRPQRYLWTDAFAVCNFLQLYSQTAEKKYLQLALDLVEQVHEILGKHRRGGPRQGWISGLEETEGCLHPTLGGLRIGKKLDERKQDQPYDEYLEWDRDGQYYHYLTKWMHALHQVSVVTGDPVFNQWAYELAKTTHSAFAYQEHPDRPKRLYWKMSIDLTYPLVPSMGHHDPLDGFVTYHEIQHLFNSQAIATSQYDLNSEISDLADICRYREWTTDDPLGLGGLLFDACRILQMIAYGAKFDEHGLLLEILQSSVAGLQTFISYGDLKAPAEQRLAFRELGLAIGLQAVPKMLALMRDVDEFEAYDIAKDQLNKLMTVVPVAKSIETFWLRPANREVASWQAHENINMVMLATSLMPDGFLNLQPILAADQLGLA